MAELTIRRAERSDLSALNKLEASLWSEDQRCSDEKFRQRMQSFPNGFLVGVADGEIVANFYAIRRNYSDDETMNWSRHSGDGTGRTHIDSGNSLFSVSITVSPNAPHGSYRRMMQAWVELARREGVSRIYAGSRVPGLHAFDGSVDEYVAKVSAREVFDPALSKAMACGFSVGKIVPGYFDDPESRNFGVEIFQNVRML